MFHGVKFSALFNNQATNSLLTLDKVRAKIDADVLQLGKCPFLKQPTCAIS